MNLYWDQDSPQQSVQPPHIIDDEHRKNKMDESMARSDGSDESDDENDS